MVRPYVKVVKQPPTSVLVGHVFEIKVQISSSGKNYQLKVDDRFDATEIPKNSDSDTPSTLRCSCSTPISNVAILIRLVCQKGTVVATTETSPVSVACQRINVATTKEFTSLWYKDEGGREKSIDLVASVHGVDSENGGKLVQACQQKGSKSLDLCLKPVLYYAPGSKGLVMVANQDILRILSEDLSLSYGGSRLIRFRIEDVSKNHQGQDFQIQLNVDGRPEIAPGISPSITVRSKRNKRCRASSTTSKINTSAKKPANSTIVASHIHQAVCCVMKWSDAAASILHAMPSNPHAALCLSEYGYIREQLGILQAASPHDRIPVPMSNKVETSLPLKRRFNLRSHKALASSNHSPLLKQTPPSETLGQIPEQSKVSRSRDEFVTESPSSCALVPKRNVDVRVVIEDLVAGSASKHSPKGTFLGMVNNDSPAEKNFENIAKADVHEVLSENGESPASRIKNGDRLFDIACNKATANDHGEDAEGIDFERVDIEEKIEYILGVAMRSRETDDYLGFPVFCAKRRFLGFVQERGFGGQSFVLPPTYFKPSDKEQASKMFVHYPKEAIFTKSQQRTLNAMAHHAMVYKWKTRPYDTFRVLQHDS